MPYEPAFMVQLERYYAEAGALRDEDDWRGFERRWLDRARWPLRHVSDREALAAADEGRLARDPRRWARTFWAYDLTAEARYHYHAVLLGPAMAARFPQLVVDAEGPGGRWLASCPYCEIATGDPGDARCPLCGRALLYDVLED